MKITLKRVFEVYVFALCLFFGSRPISDPDFWFHLRTGQFIVDNFQVPHTDLFSCTNAGQVYAAHGWLSGLIFYLVYSRWGANLLIFVFATLTALSFWIIFKRSDEHVFVRGIAVLLAAWSVLPNIGVRPRVFSLLIFSAYFVILSSYLRRPNVTSIWWLVPLMVLWVNLHGAFLIGLFFIGLTSVAILIENLLRHERLTTAWPHVRLLGLVLIACAAAALLNPYGIQIYSHVLSVLSSPIYQYVVIDWLSPDFHQSDLFPLIILIMLTVAVLALSPKRASAGEVLFFVATLYMTLKMQRNAMIFAVVASSLLADYAGPLWDSLFSHMQAKPGWLRRGFRPAFLNLVLLLPLVLFIVKLKNVVYRPPTQEMAAVPFKAVEILKEKGINGCTFTDPNVWGAYVMWAAQQDPVYIDGRDMYPPQFVREYVQIIQGQKDWRQPLQQYGVKNVILTPSSILTRQFRESSEWQEIYRDDFSVLFSRR